MAVQRVTLQLTELRCLAQSEGGSGSEPYLWTTFFAFGAEQLPFQSGPLGVITPAYDAFRTEFPDGIRAGQAVPVPVFVASAGFDMDLEAAPRPKLIGCIAVLMEEDSTPHDSIVLGRIAYSKEIEAQLNELARKRILEGTLGGLTEAEIEAVRKGVKSKVEAAVGSNQGFFDLFRNQDDTLGFTFKTFAFPVDNPATDAEIRFQFFDFPEIGIGTTDRFVLSGRLSLGPVPKPPIVICAAQRAALDAKREEITSLQTRVQLLQTQLVHAAPGAKAALVAQITETNTQITMEEALLPALQAALDACLGHQMHGDAAGPVSGGILTRS
ncbi:MAG: hypothetical protein WBN04_18750 [Paracoccaceae bacterium]